MVVVVVVSRFLEACVSVAVGGMIRLSCVVVKGVRRRFLCCCSHIVVVQSSNVAKRIRDRRVVSLSFSQKNSLCCVFVLVAMMCMSVHAMI